jgi:hypothetical protein
MNGIIFLISFSACSLLVYRKITDFHVLIFYSNIRVSFFAQAGAWIMILLLYALLCHWDHSHAPPHPAFFSFEMGLANFFAWGWPRTVFLPISVSKVAKNTDVSI